MMSWLIRWHEKQERMKLGLRNGRMHHLLGDRLFHQHVWGFDERSVAVGLALGLFIAFTPTIPFQMLMCAIGAILLRVNLSVAIAAIWITNPLTAVPIYLAASRVGRHFFEHSRLGEFTLAFFGFQGRTGKFMEQGLFLWTGCLVFSIVSAGMGYATVRAVWGLWHRRKDKRRTGMMFGRHMGYERLNDEEDPN